MVREVVQADGLDGRAVWRGGDAGEGARTRQSPDLSGQGAGSRAGKVSCSGPSDLPDDYDPAAGRPAVGVGGRAAPGSSGLLSRAAMRRLGTDGGAGSVVDLDAVQELAYLLFSIAEKQRLGSPRCCSTAWLRPGRTLTQASGDGRLQVRRSQPGA